MDLTLFLNHQCNLRCTYCYNGEKYGRRMPSSTMRQALDLGLSRAGRRLHLSFFGGEPLMELPLIRETLSTLDERLAERHNPPSVGYAVNTNATLIDDEAVELLTSRDFMAHVSLDGPREVNDAVRVNAAGRGSYDDVIAGLARLRAAGVPFQLMSVLGAANGRHLADTLRTLAPLGARRLTLTPNYADDWTPRAVEELREGLSALGDVWMDLFRAGQTVVLEPLHGKILSHLHSGNACPSRCQLGGDELAVSPAGRIYPCAQNIREDRDHELVIGHVDTGFDSAALRRLQAQKDRVEETCAPCELKHRCQSHCGCRHVALSGELGKITAVLCELEAAFIDEADRVAERLYAERCPAFLDLYYRKTWTLAPGAQLVRLGRRPEAPPAREPS